MKMKNLTQYIATNINRKGMTLLFTSFLTLAILGLSLFHLYSASAQNDPVSFGDGRGIQMIDPAGLNTVPFWNFRGDAVEFTLYDLPTERLLTNYTRLNADGNPSWDTEGLTVQQTWTLTNTATSSDQMWPVPLPKDTPSGIYIIKGISGEDKADSMIVVGRNTLMLKRGNNGQVVAWASALQNGAPAVGMEVTFYNTENGAEVGKALTNEMGVAELNSGNTADVMAIGRIASEAVNEVALAATDEHWRNYSAYNWQAQAPEDYRIYLYTDRSIYRPGHTIKFDTIVRNIGQNGYSPIAASTVMTATLRDPRNTIVDTVALRSDALGTANDEFVLGDEPPLGTYNVELQVGDQIQRQQLKVEEYSKPEYGVEVSTPKSYAILGDPIPVTVDANYFFGQPVTDAKVLLRVYRRPIYRYWWWWEDDGYFPYRAPNGQVDTFSGTTDSEGRWTMDFEPPLYGDGAQNAALYSFEAEVTDLQEKPIQGQTSVRAYWNTLDLKVSAGKYGYRTNEPITLEWTAQDRDGVAVANQVLDVRLEKDYYARDDENESIESHQVTTDDQGKASLTLEAVSQGWYRILATTTDDKGRVVEARRYLWVYDPAGRSWWYTNNDQISIMLDKESYSVGDTAQLLIQSRIEKGVALLTLERDGVHQEQIVNIDGPMTTVEVPITEDFSPNIFARIHLFNPYSSADFIPNREGELLTAQVELDVPSNEKRLTVDIRTDAEQYKPGDEAKVTIQLSAAGGQPVAGRVTLALVDEAIFALQADLSADIFDTFYGTGSNRVGIYDSLARGPHYSRFTMLEDEVFPESETQKDDGASPPPQPTATPPSFGDTDDSTESSDPRTTFLDTAYWEAGIAVGAEGVATIAVPLPDNLTTWRIIVRAVTPETYVGEAKAELLVTKEIISRPTLPRFAVLGDVFELKLLGQNFTGEDLTGSASIETDHLVILNEQPSIALNLPDKGTDVAPWTAVASGVGTGVITTTLNTPRGNDTVALPLLTKPFAIPDRWSTSGQANPSATETFTVPFNAVNQASELTVRLSPSIALGLLDGLDDLIAYPYGCVEQTMSRVLPSAVAIQAYAELNISNPKAGELPSIINKGLQKLYGYQHDDGRWGWFYDDDGGVYLTSYVLLGLTRVQKAGFAVDQGVLDNGFAALDRALQNNNNEPTPEQPDQRQNETSSNGVRAFALYVKALGGKGDVAAALELANVSDSLRSDALGLLALALDLDGETEKAQSLIDVLIGRAEEVGSTAFWSVPDDNWDWYHWRTMASSDKNTAIAVLALSQLRKDHELLPKAVRWLMDHRRGSSWRNTQATAFAVLGLLEYIKVSGELESNYAYTVAFNGNEVASGQVTSATVTQPIAPIIIPGGDLKIGDNEVTISRSPGVSAASLEQQNPLYYTVLLQQQLFQKNFTEVSSKSQGLALKRSYSLAEGKKRDDGYYNVGDVVEVKLELEISDEVWYLLVRDPLPAGFEALNERLNSTSYGGEFGFFWRSWGYNRKDVRDDSVDFFITHGWAGTRTFTYRMRATTAGTFSVLPAEAYPMYAEEIWGRSGSTQVSVEPERLDPRPAFALSDVDKNCRIERFDTLQVVGAWGTADEDSEVHLDDIAEVASLQGSDCVNPAALNDSELPAGLLVLIPQREVTAGEEVRVHVIGSGTDGLGGIEMNLGFDETILEFQEVILNPAMGDDVLPLGPKIDEETGDVLVGAVELPRDDAGGDTVRASMANAQTVMTVVLKGKADGAVSLDINQVQAMDSQGHLMVASSSLVHRDELDKHIYLPMISQGGASQR